MSVADIARIVGRWWFVALVPPLLGLALVAFLATGPQYYTARTEFVFLAPDRAAVSGLPDDLAGPLINFAGAVQSRYAEEHVVVRVSSPTATLYGNNVREGASVMLASAGNQWESSFNRPVLVIQVIDTTPEAVRGRLAALSSDLAVITEDLQRSAGANPEDYITLETPSHRVALHSFGPTRTETLKGSVAILMVAGGCGIGLAAGMERLRPRREGSRP